MNETTTSLFCPVAAPNPLSKNSMPAAGGVKRLFYEWELEGELKTRRRKRVRGCLVYMCGWVEVVEMYNGNGQFHNSVGRFATSCLRQINLDHSNINQWRKLIVTPLSSGCVSPFRLCVFVISLLQLKLDFCCFHLRLLTLQPSFSISRIKVNSLFQVFTIIK